MALTRVGAFIFCWFPCLLSQITDFTGPLPVETALETLTNIDDVTVTWTPTFTFDVDNLGTPTSRSTLELRYEITFTGDCVRGDIPDAALVPVCALTSPTAEVTSACR